MERELTKFAEVARSLLNDINTTEFLEIQEEEGSVTVKGRMFETLALTLTIKQSMLAIFHMETKLAPFEIPLDEEGNPLPLEEAKKQRVQALSGVQEQKINVTAYDDVTVLQKVLMLNNGSMEDFKKGMLDFILLFKDHADDFLCNKEFVCKKEEVNEPEEPKEQEPEAQVASKEEREVSEVEITPQINATSTTGSNTSAYESMIQSIQAFLQQAKIREEEVKKKESALAKAQALLEQKKESEKDETKAQVANLEEKLKVALAKLATADATIGELKVKAKETEEALALARENTQVSSVSEEAFTALKAEKEQTERDLILAKEEITKARAMCKEEKDRADQLEANLMKERAKVSTLPEMEATIQELKEQLEKEKGELKRERSEQDIKEEATQIMEAFAYLGITMSVVPGNGEMVLASERTKDTPAIDVFVNVKAQMLYIQMERASKKDIYTKQLERWDAEDIRKSYSLHSEKIVVKAKYENAAKDAKDIMDRLKTL